ncbi:MAG: TolC family protein [Candidatus Eisenbacteria bacterium]|nr:TolC family protein [Candidatus Eisenbacteria bacterium]
MNSTVPTALAVRLRPWRWLLQFTAAVVWVTLCGCAGTDRTLLADWRAAGDPAHGFAPSESERDASDSGPPERYLTLGVGERASRDAVLSSLDEVLRTARERSPRLASAWFEWEAALAREPQAGSWPDPMVGYGYLAREIETRVGPQRHRFSISQNVPLGRTGPASAAAREGAREGAASFEATWWAVRESVTSSWYELYRLARAREVLEAHFEILRGWEEIARVRYTTGQLDYAALLRVQVEIAKLSDEIESTKESARVATAKLNAELDRDADAPIEAATEIDMHSVDTGPIEGGRGDLDALLVEFRQSNPAVEVAQRRVSQLELREVVARRSTWPELSLGIEYLETGPARMETAESGKDAVVLKVGASIPLGRSRNRAIREEAEARTEARRRDLVRTQRTEEASLLASAYAYRDADRRVSFLEQEQIPRIAQSIEVMEEQFAAGDAMLLELLDLQRTWLDAELQLDRARAERGERLAQVEASLGRELESKGETR